MADWSELPSELLELISNLTNTSSEIRRFRSVCHSWRSSVTVKPVTPFASPIINLMSFSSEQTHQPFNVRLIKQTTFLLSLSSNPNSCWVLKTEEHKHKPGVFSLMTPFSNKNFMKNFGYNILDLSNLKTFEVGHEYVVRNVSESDHNIIDQEKVAFSFVGNGYDDFILLSTHNSTGKLLMYRSNFQEWTFLDDFALGYDDGGDFAFDWSMIYVDVVSYNGRFYAVTDSGRTVVITFDDDMTPAVDLTVKSITGGDKKCLVKSADDLLLVDLYTCSQDDPIEINAIDVFKMDIENNNWVVLKSLGGRSIFLSNYSSFSTNSVYGIKENCIYFSFKKLGRDFLEKKGRNLNGKSKGDCYDDDDVVETSEIGVFNYDKGCFGSLEDYTENSELFSWPPPPWLNFLR